MMAGSRSLGRNVNVCMIITSVAMGHLDSAFTHF